MDAPKTVAAQVKADLSQVCCDPTERQNVQRFAKVLLGNLAICKKAGRVHDYQFCYNVP